MHQIDAIKAEFPRSGDNITVNVTLISGGSRNNIIPDYAEATLNVRGRTKDEMAQVGKVARDVAAHPKIDGTTVDVDYTPKFPPLVQNERVSAVAARASKYQAELGSPLALGGNGGASESALADAAGTPTLDGLGSTGAGAHTPDETIDLSSVTPRLYVLTRLIASYGKGEFRK
jgi:glutamate carboxypeptidase